jgi:hypothetical protein
MPASQSLDELAENSKFTFVGTVERLNASTVATHPATSHSVVVKVERTLESPPAFGDLAGQRLTVELTTAPGVKVGDRAIFFTNGLVYAEGIVVQEVGRIPAAAPERLERQVQQVLKAYKQGPARNILRRLATADVVVTGKVSAVRKLPRAPDVPISEHDPDWHEAIVNVQGVESGLPMKQVSVMFPASRDVRWHQAPKFSPGQEGTWILHQHQVRGLRIPGYTALQPADFQPKPRRKQIQALIQMRRQQQ